MGKIRVNNPGILTTIQDLGRKGYQQYGIGPGGPMDQFAMEVANALVGNPRSNPVLEMPLIGGSYLTTEDCLIALTGANMEPSLDGQAIGMYETILWKKGQVLFLGPAKDGIRTYLALGVDLGIEPVLGSYSTHIRSRLGGLDGGPLKAGDQIAFRGESKRKVCFHLAEKDIPSYGREARIRLVLGPQDEAFTEEGKETFLSQTYTISMDSDRMGYRLEGKPIAMVGGADIISDGLVFGSIQVSGNGQPTIMMADHQTSGGYAKIATVIRSDLSILAQMGPGEKLEFEALSPNTAQELYREWRLSLDQIEKKFLKGPRQKAFSEEDKDLSLALVEAFSRSGLESLYLIRDSLEVKLKK